ncbi:MAG TPA: riboflavin synthase [Micromonospora sp.]|jgi:riboflavin synthase
MFTGIIEELGEAVRLDRHGDSAVLTVRGPRVAADAQHGDSIAVNGVCLTVVTTSGDTFTVDVMKETLDRTTLGTLAPGDPVNLERAATLATRLGGHLVQGHVDGVGTILARVATDRWHEVRIGVPAELARYVVPKGSIAVDGISLTVVSVADEPTPAFTVHLIPTTLALTTLGRKEPGAAVNLEVDVMAKYVERLLTAARPAAGER